MHYAFDRWMAREHPGCPFERYADDIVVHCDTENQAQQLRVAIATRLETVGLELHPDKTKVAYCKDANRPGDAEHTSLDFLGYTSGLAWPKAEEVTSRASPQPSAARRGRRSARRSGAGISTVGAGRTCPASLRRLIRR